MAKTAPHTRAAAPADAAPADAPLADATLADVQGGRDARNIAIDQVGVKNMRHPLVIADGGQRQHTVARVNIYASLAAADKGTHMSRFVETLDACAQPVSVENFPQILLDLRRRLPSDRSQLELTFPYFLRKTAPVSGARSWLDYEVTLRCELAGARTDAYVQVVVPATSLCPCSKQISAYGAHNQRAHITVAAHAAPRLGIAELIRMVERQASAELYALLKRADEKFVTEYAYDRPKFVEDIIRDVAATMDQDARVLDYTVSVENFESIHNHSVYAEIRRGQS